MEGPTPISALIHAATMVTAGVFMVARMSPLFELSETALSTVLIIGATGALFTGLLGVVMNDIKRVVAYSTLSQLGYMMVAMGASAYSAGIFHLATHACFKALLFLGAGSVIIGMHHEQDMRKMGGLYRYMPITYWTMLVGSLALCAIPPFAGFYSKDTIINAAKLSTIYGSGYAYYCVAIGAMVTAIYSFRLLFMTFHGEPRMDEHTKSQLHESPSVVWAPLVILAVPSVLLGMILYHPMLFAKHGLLENAIFVLPKHNVLAHFEGEETHVLSMTLHVFMSPAFWLTLLGIVGTWYCYMVNPKVPEMLAKRLKFVYRLLMNKYGFDDFNEKVLVPLTLALGKLFYKVGDKVLIDGLFVNGSARFIGFFSKQSARVQTGYLYHYLAVMVFGLLALLAWLLLG